MANQDILNYIRDTRKRGFSNGDIRDALLNAGWRMDDIKDAFDCITESDGVEVAAKKVFSIKKSALGAAIAGMIFFLTASAALGGYYYYSTIPARALEKMRESAGEIKSFKFGANLLFSSPNADIQLISSGAVDILDENNHRSYSKHDLDFDSPEISAKVCAETKSFGDAAYVYLDFPLESNDPAWNAMVEMAGIQKKWMKIGRNEIEKFAPSSIPLPLEENEKSAEVNPISSFMGAGILSFASIKKSNTGIDENSNIADGIKNLLENYHIFKIKEYSGKEVIQNAAVRRVKFDLDKIELARFIFDNYQNSAGYNIEQFEKEIAGSLEAVKSASGDIWIGKDAGYLYRLALEILMESEDAGKCDFKFAIEFSDFNKPVSVEVPQESESILDVLERIGLRNKINNKL